ncbi:MAG: sugar phosphate isomerase/epimerase family protein [Bacteroidota bacterium]
MSGLDKLCIHTITTKPWRLQTAAAKYAAAGVGGISIWRNVFEESEPHKVRQVVEDYGLEVVSLVRGGFFADSSASRRLAAIDDNRQAIEQAAIVKAPMVVLVCGASTDQPLETSRGQIEEGIVSLLPLAEELGVKLAIEPLHPMYADFRSAINTLRQANEMAESINSPYVGIAVDVYHLWWDPDLEQEIQRCGAKGNLLAYHICDWKSPTEDMLNDRGLMGEGCINLRQIGQWVADAGFTGFEEVEIFSNRYWKMDQDEFLERIVKAYRALHTPKQ